MVGNMHVDTDRPIRPPQRGVQYGPHTERVGFVAENLESPLRHRRRAGVVLIVIEDNIHFGARAVAKPDKPDNARLSLGNATLWFWWLWPALSPKLSRPCAVVVRLGVRDVSFARMS